MNLLNTPFQTGKERGFSLVELMVVVAIIGILAALAVPRFQKFQAKARQSEVKTNMSHVYTLQESFRADNESYSNAGALSNDDYSGNDTCNEDNELGFRITDCTKVRYVYTNTGGMNDFTATGTEIGTAGDGSDHRVFPGCTDALDTWTINEQKVLTNSSNALQLCQD